MHSRSSRQAALAGLVLGSFWMANVWGRPVSDGAVYFSNNSQALLPLPKIAVIEVFASRPAMSAGTTLRMLLSEEPIMSQLAMTSQIAILCESKSRFFSVAVVGSGSFVMWERTFQKRFCGCP